MGSGLEAGRGQPATSLGRPSCWHPPRSCAVAVLPRRRAYAQCWAARWSCPYAREPPLCQRGAGTQGRRQYKEMEIEDLNRCAVKLQCTFRGHLVRTGRVVRGGKVKPNWFERESTLYGVARKQFRRPPRIKGERRRPVEAEVDQLLASCVSTFEETAMAMLAIRALADRFSKEPGVWTPRPEPSNCIGTQ